MKEIKNKWLGVEHISLSCHNRVQTFIKHLLGLERFHPFLSCVSVSPYRHLFINFEAHNLKASKQWSEILNKVRSAKDVHFILMDWLIKITNSYSSFVLTINS